MAIAGGALSAAAFAAQELAASAVDAASCETRALERPLHIRGAYTSHAKNNHLYRETFTLRGLTGCDAYGMRRVIVSQESNWLKDIDKGVPWVKNGESITFKTNHRERVAKTYRAVHECNGDGRGGTYDKTHHTKVRPVVRLTWMPKGGARPEPVEYHGHSTLACK